MNYKVSLILLLCAACTTGGPLPRGKATTEQQEAFASYLAAVEDHNEELHSIMVLKSGKVLLEKQIATKFCLTGFHLTDTTFVCQMNLKFSQT